MDTLYTLTFVNSAGKSHKRMFPTFNREKIFQQADEILIEKLDGIVNIQVVEHDLGSVSRWTNVELKK